MLRQFPIFKLLLHASHALLPSYTHQNYPPPHPTTRFKSIKLIFKIKYFRNNQKPKSKFLGPYFKPPPSTFQRHLHLIFVPLLSEGRAGESWEPSNNVMLFSFHAKLSPPSPLSSTLLPSLRLLVFRGLSTEGQLCLRPFIASTIPIRKFLITKFVQNQSNGSRNERFSQKS